MRRIGRGKPTLLNGNFTVNAIGEVETYVALPPGNFAATFYALAPRTSWLSTATPEIVGAVVAKSSYANGNVSWHYDRALDSLGNVVDFRIASYVEDIR